MSRLAGAVGAPNPREATGGSPATADAEGLRVQFDGRIYNRDELGVEGDDATALARLVRRHGPAGAMGRLNADLAAAVHEPATGRLWLLRDRLGLRPLYWCRTGGGVAYASRPRTLFGSVPGGPVPDARYVARIAGSHYRTFDNDPSRSPYVGIQQVPAGHGLEVSGRTTRAERYWEPSAWPKPVPRNPAELALHYRELLEDAVRRRMAVVDRPGFTLSGGMDSSSVLACAARISGPQPAYSTVYDDPTYDEGRDIEPMLGPIADPWTPVRVDEPDVLDTVARMVADHDEPVATATWLSHRELAAVVQADGITTLFGGLGGDELNAGEYEYFPFHFADLRRSGAEDELADEVAAWAAHHDHPVFRKDRAAAETLIAALTRPHEPGRCLPDRARLVRYAGAVAPELSELAAAEPVMEHPFPTCLQNRCWQDLTRETLPCCLRAEDRTAAAFGIDRVHPFLDHRLVELMMAVPGDRKIRDGVTKRLLREAMEGILPEETRTRVAKTGWNAPAHVWFAGRGLEDVRDLIASRSFRERGVYDVRAVVGIVDEHERIVAGSEPAENHMMFLWQLVNTELWLRNLDEERASGAGGEVTSRAAPPQALPC
ncbi:MAG: asparagine synthetase B family protein [Miltoncostaeaceae bacterium]